MRLTSSIRLVDWKTGGQAGVTLIELMVASIILGLAVTGVLALVGSGRSLEYQNSLYAQARSAGNSILEDPYYRYSNYTSLSPIGPSTPHATVANDAPYLKATPTAPSTFDTISVTITEVTVTNWIAMTGSGTPLIPVRKIDLTQKWKADGTDQTLTLSKWICQIR